MTGTTTLPVFFCPQMVATTSASFSPSAAKPGRAVADWQKHGLSIEIYPPLRATRPDFRRVHSRDYVDGVLDLKADNGFGNRDPGVAESLPWTTGALMAAAAHAIDQKITTCAPVSGFHHAGFDFAEGFCTFNGLMVTAQWLLKHDIARKVAIIDFDFHYGNGTDDIIAAMHLGESVMHYTAGNEFTRPDQAREFLSRVPFIVRQAMDWVRGPHGEVDGIVLYQAGADAHILDPLGGFLTTEQLAKRDRDVLGVLAAYGIPCAFVLAGGYQRDDRGTIEPVLEIHRNTVLAATRGI